MTHRRKLVAALTVLCLSTQLLGCGTILYPERRGQPAGKLDAQIVILDGIGLLFFLVPGVVAFAVDFSTGAIYLPKGGKSRIGEVLSRMEVDEEPFRARSIEDVEQIVRDRLGIEVDLRSDAVIVVPGRPGQDPRPSLRALYQAMDRGLGTPGAS